MPEPISLCLENLDDPPEQMRFIRCVALAGGEPGLGIDARGRPLWRGRSPAELACELWVSMDDQLILWRRPAAPPVTVRRAQRSLAAPAERPIVLLDQDELELAGVHLRVHVHGVAEEIHPPEPFIPRSVGAAALAAAMALGSVAAGCERGGDGPDMLGEPPSATAVAATAAPTDNATTAPSATATETLSSSASSAPTATATPTSSASATKTQPIEVRHHPPKPVLPKKDDMFSP